MRLDRVARGSEPIAEARSFLTDVQAVHGILVSDRAMADDPGGDPAGRLLSPSPGAGTWRRCLPALPPLFMEAGQPARLQADPDHGENLP